MQLNATQKRRKRLALCKRHLDAEAFAIGQFLFSPVHVIGDTYPPDAEYDFYLITDKDGYLLRLRNTPNNRLILCKHDPLYYDFIYIVVEKELRLDIRQELEQVAALIERIKIPKKIMSEIVYPI